MEPSEKHKNIRSSGYHDPEQKYIARCIRKLKEEGLPLDGWYCIEVYDVREEDQKAPLETCQVCGCSRVRFVHVMENDSTHQRLNVGCICAGVMEGDIFGAKERERQAKNRLSRRRSFLQKPWMTGVFDGMLFQKKSVVVMSANDRGSGADENADAEALQQVSYTVYVDDQQVTEYKGKPIRDPLTAKYAAFEVLDPPDPHS